MTEKTQIEKDKLGENEKKKEVLPSVNIMYWLYPKRQNLEIFLFISMSPFNPDCSLQSNNHSWFLKMRK